MASDQVHERVFKILIKDIFTHKLKPGTKLPPERILTAQLEVDRTSLRVALKQMESMNLLDIRQGDGVYVKDYLKFAGMDFLRHLFTIKNDEGTKEWFLDEYFLDEIYDFWVAVFPEMIKLAARRVTPRDVKALVSIIDEELENLDDMKKVLAYEERQQAIMAEIGNNVIFLRFSNSARPIRRTIIQTFAENVDRDTLKRFLEAKKLLIQWYAREGTIEKADAAAEKYREILADYRNDFKRLALQRENRGTKN